MISIMSARPDESNDAVLVVVDDDPPSLHLSDQVLRAAGFHNIHLYTDPGQALRDSASLEVDMVIADLQMPEIDGLQLLTELRSKVPDGGFLPVVIVTADAATQTRRRALAMGADEFLTKPIDVVEMTLRVRHLLDMRAMHNALADSKRHLEFEVEARTEQLNASLTRLENLVETKDMFIASVSHELRTPLTAILGFAIELAERAPNMSDEEVTSSARIIAEQASDLSAIIEDLLVAARADIDKVTALREPVHLEKEVGAVIEAMSGADQARVEALDGEAAVWGDHVRVRQVLRNLISNALRHGGEHVSVQLGNSSDVGTVTVLDDGTGIDPELRERIFEPYIHGRGDVGQPASIGLGLAVSRFLARLMGGDLALVTHPDGTAFRLSLPAHPDVGEMPSDSEVRRLSRRGSHESVGGAATRR
jgi:signal transduction histidine kinase